MEAAIFKKLGLFLHRKGQRQGLRKVFSPWLNRWSFSQGGLKVCLSIFIVYHLYSVLLIPNSQNYLGLRSAPWVEPYVNFFEFVTEWGFFAPNPGPPPLFIEWELYDRDGKTIEASQWPAYPNPYFWDERQGRRIVLGRFMALEDRRAEKLLAPYLCRQNQNGASVTLWRIHHNLRSLIQGVRGFQPVSGEMAAVERHLMSHNFCEEFKK